MWLVDPDQISIRDICPFVDTGTIFSWHQKCTNSRFVDTKKHKNPDFHTKTHSFTFFLKPGWKFDTGTAGGAGDKYQVCLGIVNNAIGKSGNSCNRTKCIPLLSLITAPLIDPCKFNLCTYGSTGKKLACPPIPNWWLLKCPTQELDLATPL